MASSSNGSGWEIVPDLGVPEAMEVVGLSDSPSVGQETVINFNATLKQCKSSPIQLFTESVDAAAPSDDREFLLKLEAKPSVRELPSWLRDVKDEKVNFLVVLDRSGSMGGTPWNQVQSAMRTMLQLTSANDKISTTILIYNGSAEFLELGGDPTAQIDSIRANGSTDFVEAFEKIAAYLEAGGVAPAPAAAEEEPEDRQTLSGKIRKTLSVKTKPKKVTIKDSKDAEKKKVYVFFMTDGCDTCNEKQKIMLCKEHLETRMSGYGADVIVNVLGFSASHDDAFLESLSLMGTTDGSYAYVDPQDGPEALEKRLTDLLELTTGLVGRSVYLDLKLDGGGRFLGDWFGVGQEEIVLQAFVKIDGEQATISTWKFISLPVVGSDAAAAAANLRLRVNLLKDLRESVPPVPCRVVGPANMQKFDENAQGGREICLRKLRTSLGLLTAQIGGVEGEGGADALVNKLKPWYDKIKSGAEKLETTPADADDAAADDTEAKKIRLAITNGLSLCQNVIEPQSRYGSSEAEDRSHRTRKMKGIQQDYAVRSDQMHNMPAVSSNIRSRMSVASAMPSKAKGSSKYRSEQQSKKSCMD